MRTHVTGLSFALFLGSSSAFAFGTGGHFEATERGLRIAGFNGKAIALAQISNYQVDFMSNKPMWSILEKWGERIRYFCDHFHFDNLVDANGIATDFAWIEKMAKPVVEQAVRENNPEKVLNALGIVLHAVQDLYSHSNFPEQPWTKWVGPGFVTFDDVAEEIWKGPAFKIFTGAAGSKVHPVPDGWPSHGSHLKKCSQVDDPKGCGLNHDSVWRNNHLVALEMASRATYHWAKRFERWTGNAKFWKNVQNYAGELDWNCVRRAEQTSKAAGQWGYPAEISSIHNLRRRMLNAMMGVRCSSGWQDDRWAYGTLRALLFEGKQPSKGYLDRSYNFDAPDNRKGFKIPPRGGMPREAFFGTYDLVFGITSKPAKLVLQAGSGADEVRGTLDGALVTGKVDGPQITLQVGKLYEGKGHLMTHTKDAIAGFLRNKKGVPTGFYAVKKR